MWRKHSALEKTFPAIGMWCNITMIRSYVTALTTFPPNRVPRRYSVRWIVGGLELYGYVIWNQRLQEWPTQNSSSSSYSSAYSGSVFEPNRFAFRILFTCILTRCINLQVTGTENMNISNANIIWNGCGNAEICAKAGCMLQPAMRKDHSRNLHLIVLHLSVYTKISLVLRLRPT